MRQEEKDAEGIEEMTVEPDPNFHRRMELVRRSYNAKCGTWTNKQDETEYRKLVNESLVLLQKGLI